MKQSCNLLKGGASYLLHQQHTRYVRKSVLISHISSCRNSFNCGGMKRKEGLFGTQQQFAFNSNSTSADQGLESVSQEEQTADQDLEMMGTRLLAQVVEVSWSDQSKSYFNYAWLYDNCFSMLTSSNQKKYRSVKDLIGVKPISMAVSENGGELQVDWPATGEREAGSSIYPAQFLRQYSLRTETFKDQQNALKAMNQPRDLVEIDYSEILDQTESHSYYRFLKAINDFGIVLVRNAPSEDGTVLKLANLIDNPSHSIYGDKFDVKVDSNPINIAYTKSSLEFHMDLAYYESPPGLQFLHAIEFPSSIKGGESTFVDGHAVAEELKQTNQSAFQVLKTIPATFRKHHLTRDNPLILYYQRPHIVTNHFDEVISVFWSPPFEGPLSLPPETTLKRDEMTCSLQSAVHSEDDIGSAIEAYYEAYAVFQDMINSSQMLKKHGYEFRLQEGDIVVFNNRRMLHARNSFENVSQQSSSAVASTESHRRHLQGCYIDIDSFLNSFRLLSSEYNGRQQGIAATGETRAGISHFR